MGGWTTLAPEQVFWGNVCKTDRCWIWIGYISGGYGIFEINKRPTRAHRFSMELHGISVNGLDVLHLCNNRSCVNPSHLSVGTDTENMIHRTAYPNALPLGMLATPKHQIKAIQEYSRSELGKFERNFDMGTDCWIWRGAQKSPFTKTTHKGIPTTASRISWTLYNGPIPRGMHVLHKCDNPRCMRPDHLFLGTNADNVADKVRKGRCHDQRGTKNGNAKLTEKEISCIRKLYSEGLSDRVLAKRFRIWPGHVWRIVAGKAWTHYA